MTIIEFVILRGVVNFGSLPNLEISLRRYTLRGIWCVGGGRRIMFPYFPHSGGARKSLGGGHLEPHNLNLGTKAQTARSDDFTPLCLCLVQLLPGLSLAVKQAAQGLCGKKQAGRVSKPPARTSGTDSPKTFTQGLGDGRWWWWPIVVFDC